MIPDILLTIAAVTAPEPTPLPPESPTAWFTLKLFSRQQEVVGPHEQWYRWDSEIEYVRSHWHNLRGAPPLAAMADLPSPGQIEDLVERNRRQQEEVEWLAAGACQRDRDRLAEALSELNREADWLWRCRIVRSAPAWAAKRMELQQLVIRGGR